MTPIQQTTARDQPQHCSAAQGGRWIAQGWQLFRQMPGVWVAIVIIWFLIQAAANLLPLASIAMGVLGPVFSGGILMAARRQEAAEDIGIKDLFSGFTSDRFGPLALLGLFSMLLILLAVIIVAGVFVVILGGIEPDPAQMAPAQWLVGVLLLLVLMLPVIMALWFSASLVALHEVAPARAFALSFAGCLKNIASLTVFSLLVIPLGLLALLPMGLGLLVLGPVLLLAMYRAYVDIFRSPQEAGIGGTRAEDLGWPR